MTSTSRRRHATRTGAAVLLAGLGLSSLTACGSGPTHAGAAAVVGDTRISTTALVSLTDRALANSTLSQQVGGKQADFQRQELARLVNHEVLLRTAQKLGVTVSGGEVDDRMAAFADQAGGQPALEKAAAEQGVPVRDLHGFVSDIVLRDLVADALTKDVKVSAADLKKAYDADASHYDQVHAAHILVADQATADSVLAKVEADPSRFAALAARYSTDTANKDQGGDLGWHGKGTFVTDFENAVFAAKPGSYLEVHTQFGWHVVHVIAHRTTTLDQARTGLRRTILQDQRQKALSAALTKTADELGVSVNPRFGTYDAASGAITSPGSSIVVPAGGATAASPAAAGS